MREELIINGQRMDLAEDTGISLEFRSNALGDISKIVSSYSYTIKLPNTTRNRRVLGDPANPSAGTPQTRRFLPARYWRNGIDLMGSCRAAVLSAGATIDVALYWGGLSFLQAWISSDMKLRDILPARTVTAARIPDAYEILNTRGYGNALVSTGVTPTDAASTVALPPSMRHDLILEGIAASIRSATGRTDFRFDTSHAGVALDRWTPVQTLRSARSTSNYYHADTTRLEDIGNDEILLNGVNGFGPGHVYNEGAGYALVTLGQMAHQIVVDINLNINADFALNGQALRLEMRAVSGELRSWPLRFDGNYLRGSVRDTVSFAETMSYRLIVTGISARYLGAYTEADGQLMEIAPLREIAQPGDTVDIVENLPDMKALDFIKGICAYYGLACMPDPKNEAVIRLLSYDYVFNTLKAQARNWSGKLQGREIESMLSRTEFRVGSYAQRSEIRWKDDRANPATAEFPSGVLTVQDETLPESAVLVTLPFAATQNSFVPFYKEEAQNDGTYKISLNKPEPRILALFSAPSFTAPVGALTAAESLPTVVAERYAPVQKMLNNPIKLTAYLRLTEADLQDIDLAVPVSFKQLGHCYLIESIKTDNSSQLCEVELIQI